MHYIDTSVLAAYYCPESLSSKVQKVLGRVEIPAISPLVELELRSALSLKVRSGELKRVGAEQIAARFQAHQADGLYRTLPIGPREHSIARGWLSGFDSPLRTLDALQLAATFANDATLLSADRRLIQCAEQFGVKHQRVK